MISGARHTFGGSAAARRAGRARALAPLVLAAATSVAACREPVATAPPSPAAPQPAALVDTASTSAAVGLTATATVSSTATTPPTLTATATLTPTATAAPTMAPTIAPTASVTVTTSAEGGDAGGDAGGPAPTAAAPRAAAAGSGVRGGTGARLRIPSIGVDAAIQAVGKTATGEMGIPANGHDVAWYAPGARWGTAGNVAIAGHLDNRDGSPAVFWRLGDLSAGDEAYVDDPSGRTFRYVVDTKLAFLVDEAPLARLFGATDERNLNLITCHGRWSRAQHRYNQRLAVIARLAE